MRKYYPKYLDREVYKRVVSVAQGYEDNKRRVKAIEYDKINSSPTAHGGGSPGGISKPVQAIAEQIESHTQLLCSRISAVEKALARFPGHEQKFIRQNVIDRVPMRYCDTVNCERTLKCIRHDFLIALALELHEII